MRRTRCPESKCLKIIRYSADTDEDWAIFMHKLGGSCAAQNVKPVVVRTKKPKIVDPLFGEEWQ